MNTLQVVGPASVENVMPAENPARPQAFRLRPLVTSMLLASGMQVAHAGLEAHGPVAANGYPIWYQDHSGLVLDFCDNKTTLELAGGWCLLLPGDVPSGAPEAFPNNFADEHFYWAANAGANVAALHPLNNSPIKITLVLGLEGAFATGAVKAGDQMVFSRVRITVSPIPFDGDYRVFTPFGVYDFPGQTAGSRMFNTVDIGLTPGDFAQALHGDVGPFLLPAAIPGGAEVPPIPALLQNPALDPSFLALVGTGADTPYPNNGRKYIADPARLGPVTGAACDTSTPATTHCQIDPGTSQPAWITSAGLKNPNIFRVEGPNGWSYETTDFTLMGRVNESPIAGKVRVDRASYTANTPDFNDLSVFVTATSATQSRIPAGTLPTRVPPQLSLYPAPCGTDAAGNPISPAGVGGVQMLSQGDLQFSKQQSLPGLAPDSICIEQIAVNAGGQTVTSFSGHTVNDAVRITEATYDPVSQQLSVTALSSDTTRDVTLTVDGFGEIAIPANTIGGKTLVKATRAPPATLFVSSSEGGLNQAQVDTGTLVGIPSLPVALNDTLNSTEDTVAQLDVLANDTNVAGGVIAVSSQPGGGTAVVNVNTTPPTVTYTPRANFFGTDSFTYSVSVNGNVSNPATVRLNVAAVNDLPVANNDSMGGVLNVPATLNLLGNDTDPDGAADLAGGVFVTGNASLGIIAGQSFTGAVPVTPTATGAQSFSYRVVDRAGAQSANTANVNVNIASSDTPAIARAQFTQKTFRWVIDGTAAVSTGQTITLKYTNGVHKPDGDTRRCSDIPAAERVNAAGHAVGTTTVNATNNWTFDTILSPTTGERNPTNNGNGTTNYWCATPTSVTATSSLTGVVTSAFAISLK